MIHLAGGHEVSATYTKDGAVISTRGTVAGVTEHLIVLDIEDDATVPTLGTIVDLTVGERTYRSTVQLTGRSTFTVLRPRELEHLAPERTGSTLPAAGS